MQPSFQPPQPKPLEGVRHVIAVSSCKGGVGKSTVAANLAVALARREHAVGLMDADYDGAWTPRVDRLPYYDGPIPELGAVAPENVP